MKTRIMQAVAAVAFGAFAGAAFISAQACSQQDLGNFLKNVSAAECATPASQQAAIANIPMGFLTEAQAAQVVALYCVGEFGTVAAPTPAPGMSPAAAAPTPAM